MEAESEGGMMAADPEDIDESVWLPRGESIITEQRRGKDDIAVVITARIGEEECVTFAQVQVRNIMNHLRAEKVLTAQHIHCGQIFELWQICAQANSGYRNNPIYAGEMPGFRRIISDAGFEGGDYEKLMAALTQLEKRLINFAIHGLATEHERWIAKRYHQHYRNAFEHLAEVMMRLRDEADERRRQKAEAENNACADDKFC